MAELITSTSSLQALCARWRALPAIALDTEFERSRTYYARPALVQVHDGEAAYLLDALQIERFTALGELLALATPVKILHASGEDLPLLARLTSSTLRAIVDTQIAAPFVGFDYAPSYDRLVKDVLGVELSKSETRSDWLTRPLSDAQLRYAEQDVDYLLPLWQRLSDQLELARRGAWVREDTERFIADRLAVLDPAESYLKLGAAREFNRRQLAILQATCDWREREAQVRDLPKRFVLRDEAALSIAQTQPSSTATLATLEHLGRKTVTRYGRALIDIVQEAMERPDNELPMPWIPGARLRAHQSTVKKLQLVVRRRANELGLPPELLATRKTLSALVCKRLIEGRQDVPRALTGWREAAITEPLLDALSSTDAPQSAG